MDEISAADVERINVWVEQLEPIFGSKELWSSERGASLKQMFAYLLMRIEGHSQAIEILNDSVAQSLDPFYNPDDDK